MARAEAEGTTARQKLASCDLRPLLQLSFQRVLGSILLVSALLGSPVVERVLQYLGMLLCKAHTLPILNLFSFERLKQKCIRNRLRRRLMLGS